MAAHQRELAVIIRQHGPAEEPDQRVSFVMDESCRVQELKGEILRSQRLPLDDMPLIRELYFTQQYVGRNWR